MVCDVTPARSACGTWANTVLRAPQLGGEQNGEFGQPRRHPRLEAAEAAQLLGQLAIVGLNAGTPQKVRGFALPGRAVPIGSNRPAPARDKKSLQRKLRRLASTIPAEELNSAQQRWSIRSDRTARPGNAIRGPFAVFLHSPDYGQLAQQLGGFLPPQDAVPRRPVRIRHSAHRQAVAARSTSGSPMSRTPERAGVTSQTIAALRSGRAPKSAPKDERAVYDFIKELYLRKRVGDRTYARLHALLGDEGMSSSSASWAIRADRHVAERVPDGPPEGEPARVSRRLEQASSNPVAQIEPQGRERPDAAAAARLSAAQSSGVSGDAVDHADRCRRRVTCGCVRGFADALV